MRASVPDALRSAAALAALALSLAPASVAQAQHQPAGKAPHGDSAADPSDPAAAEARLLSGARQLTFEGRRAGEGYFSRDGSMMVFQSEREPGNPFFQIYLMDLTTGDTQRVSPGTGKTTCSWIHPAQDKVLFASTHGDPQSVDKQKKELADRAAGTKKRYSWDYDEHYELYERDLGSNKLRKLTDARGYDAEGSWSPDGTLIAYASNRHAYTERLSSEDAETFETDKSYLMDIYIMNADGSNVRRLTDAKGYDGGPFFSPDGQRICWRRFSKDGATAEIYTMKIDGTDERQLTRMGAMSWAPYYHPSMRYLIFMTNKHGFGNFELYLVDAQGRYEPQRVTYTAGFDGLPAFLPDGTRLAWTSNRTPQKQSQIFRGQWNHDAALALLGLAPAGTPETPSVGVAVTPRLPATRPEITAADARSHVGTLASEQMEGRMTGSPGERMATGYVAAAFERLGLQPAGDGGTYFQEFDFTAGASLGPHNRLTVHDGEPSGTMTYTVDTDWRPLAFSRTGQFDAAEVVFAGYGIVAPKTEKFEEYDSYVHLAVNDKWVLVLRYMPEDASPELRQHLGPHSSLRYKAMVVRDKGARGLLVVSGPNSKVKNQLVRMRFDAAGGASSVAAVSVSDKVGGDLLRGAAKDLQELQNQWDTGEPQMGFVVPDVKLALSVDIEKVTRRGRNALARLPAGGAPSSEPCVVVGAHIDHLGRGTGSGSLARDDEKEAIHFGADDNASGVAGLLEIAELLAHDKDTGKLNLERDVIFAAWSGEELGLLGSGHFVKKLGEQVADPNDLHSVVAAYVNMDMIGRLEEHIVVQGVGSSSIWAREVERRNVPVGLPIKTQNDSVLPTDAMSFYLKGVPVVALFTGAHSDYHSPRDTPDKLNYDGLQDAARFAGLLVRSLATRADVPDYVVMEKPDAQGARAGLRAYLGTIPDYAGSDVSGLKLSGVTKGAPAEEAGLRGGDIVVELAGRKIENIYDYTYAIEALKIGQPTEVVVLRDGKRLTMTVVPGSRE